MKRNTLLAINIAVSIVLVTVILYYVGLNDVIRSIFSVNLWLLFLAILFLLIMDFLMSYRIMIVLEYLKDSTAFLNILKAHFVGMLSADFTPARSGYFATAGVLHYKYNVSSEHALVSIFGPQLFDFALKLIVGTIGIIYLLYYFIGAQQGWIIILGSLAMLFIVALMMLLLFSERFLLMFSFSEKIPLFSTIFQLFRRMQDKSHAIVKKTPELMVLLILTWSAKSISWYYVAKSVGITLHTGFPEIFFYFFLQPLVTMLEFIPSPTIAGLGLSEGGTTAIFSFFGVPTAVAATFALLARFKTTFVHLPAIPEALGTLKIEKKNS